MRIVRALMVGVLLGLLTAAALFGLAAMARTATNAWGHAYVVEDHSQVPRIDTVLVLGTAPFGVRGQRQRSLSHRLDAAAGLWHAGSANSFIVSGIRIGNDYDEATIMRDELVSRGVPASAITLDHEGNRTWDSIARARRVFGKQRLLIVSQRDHLPRALFLARHLGIEAWGVASRGVTYGGWPSTLIGDLAALVAYYDVLVRR
jgi:SanA protein